MLSQLLRTPPEIECQGFAGVPTCGIVQEWYSATVLKPLNSPPVLPVLPQA